VAHEYPPFTRRKPSVLGANFTRSSSSTTTTTTAPPL